uniref:Uncharacterized protein n=1 Tax=Brassica oleracea TaxID=3712 RepID=A0A3P6EGU8_BRAOL|nr:unnamed protein product [Brassica oleracea]
MMACGLSKSIGFSSSLKKQQEGIVTILGGISSNTSSAPSLRRTFSADLFSKNWLSDNESSPMKRISSSETKRKDQDLGSIFGLRFKKSRIRRRRRSSRPNPMYGVRSYRTRRRRSRATTRFLRRTFIL